MIPVLIFGLPGLVLTTLFAWVGAKTGLFRSLVRWWRPPFILVPEAEPVGRPVALNRPVPLQRSQAFDGMFQQLSVITNRIDETGITPLRRVSNQLNQAGGLMGVSIELRHHVSLAMHGE